MNLFIEASWNAYFLTCRFNSVRIYKFIGDE
ncbi:hypothetical protein VCSRO11_3500 [Vibrio cholerae]|nr:hypothetical protein [Vibrio cholerae]GHX71781.1 hypothetical protein VCSRO11_3500 [Vibrio cholerae]GIB93457.1 hypothetical protein VCSRO190_2752 [Vibrio cholerae]